MTESLPSLGTVVLAGGHSRRMGSDKALLAHPETGEPMLLRQIELLAACSTEAPLVSARIDQLLPSLPAQTIRVDDDGESGPLGGIVQALVRTRCEHLAVIAVDLPHLSQNEIQTLHRHLDGLDRGVYAQTPRGPQPLASIIPRSALADLQTALEGGQLSLKRLFAGPLESRMKPVLFSNEKPFQNWNRPTSSEG